MCCPSLAGVCRWCSGEGVLLSRTQACNWKAHDPAKRGGGLTLRGHDLGTQLRDDALEAWHVSTLAAGVDVDLEHLYEALSLQLPSHQAQDFQILHSTNEPPQLHYLLGISITGLAQ